MIGICVGCKQEKELSALQEFWDNKSEPFLVRCCADCKREYQELVDEINAEALALAEKQDILKDTEQGRKNGGKK